MADDFSSSQQPDDLIDVEKSITYWNSIDPDVNGMLGGFPQVSNADILGSKTFLMKIRPLMKDPSTKDVPKIRRGVDCGAGIGRITKALLVKQCTTVDIVEPVEKFTAALKSEAGVGTIFNVGLENWTPEVNAYWLIWNQWCLGHLTDTALVSYLRRCAQGILDCGLIVVKENLVRTVSGADLYDEVDSSVTRTDEKFRQLFEEAGLDIVRTELQKNFPAALYAVRMYALRPAKVRSQPPPPPPQTSSPDR